MKSKEEKLRVEKKETHEDFILKWRKENLLEYMDDLVKTAEWILRDLKDYRRRLNDKNYTKDCKMEDIVRWAINQAQQVNWKFDNGADAIGGYIEAKVRKELATKHLVASEGKIIKKD